MDAFHLTFQCIFPFYAGNWIVEQLQFSQYQFLESALNKSSYLDEKKHRLHLGIGFVKRHSRTCSCTAQDGGYPTAAAKRSISAQTGKARVFARLRLMTVSVFPTVCYFKKAEL